MFVVINWVVEELFKQMGTFVAMQPGTYTVLIPCYWEVSTGKVKLAQLKSFRFEGCYIRLPCNTADFAPSDR